MCFHNYSDNLETIEISASEGIATIKLSETHKPFKEEMINVFTKMANGEAHKSE